VELIGVTWGWHGSPGNVSVTDATAAAASSDFSLSFFKSVCVITAQFDRVEVDCLFDQALITASPNGECTNHNDQNEADNPNKGKYDAGENLILQKSDGCICGCG